MTDTELLEHIHDWGCVSFGVACCLDLLVFLVWLGGKIAMEGMRK